MPKKWGVWSDCLDSLLRNTQMYRNKSALRLKNYENKLWMVYDYKATQRLSEATQRLSEYETKLWKIKSEINGILEKCLKD